MNILLSIHTYFAFTSPMSLYGSSLCSPPTPFFSPPFPLFCFLRCVSEHGASNLGMFIRKGSCIKLPNFETRRMHLLNNALRRHPKQAAFMHHFPAITPGSMFSLRITPIYVSLSLAPEQYPNHIQQLRSALIYSIGTLQRCRYATVVLRNVPLQVPVQLILDVVYFS